MYTVLYSNRNVLPFVSTTTIEYQQNLEAPADFLPICNSGCVHKHQDTTSRWKQRPQQNAICPLGQPSNKENQDYFYP